MLNKYISVENPINQLKFAGWSPPQLWELWCLRVNIRIHIEPVNRLCTGILQKWRRIFSILFAVFVYPLRAISWHKISIHMHVITEHEDLRRLDKSGALLRDSYLIGELSWIEFMNDIYCKRLQQQSSNVKVKWICRPIRIYVTRNSTHCIPLRLKQPQENRLYLYSEMNLNPKNIIERVALAKQLSHFGRFRFCLLRKKMWNNRNINESIEFWPERHMLRI